MRYIGLVSTYLVLLLMLATLPDSAVGTVAFGLVITAVAVTVVAVGGRKNLLGAMFGVAVGPDARQGRLRGSFRRQQRPDEAGRPMPRAPGALVGALQPDN